MRITLESLRALGACEAGLADFRKAFPRGLAVKPGARLTPRTAERLVSLARHFDWFASTLPAEAEAEYNRATAAARAEYDRVRAAAWEEYDRVRAEAEAEYDRARDAAWEEYDRVRAAAWEEFLRARAGALWRALGGA